MAMTRCSSPTPGDALTRDADDPPMADVNPEGGQPVHPYPEGASLPLYLRIRHHLISRVLHGEWKPGECLPSELRLAEEYDASQGTVRRAIENMAISGLVFRQAGKGTFVTSYVNDPESFRFHRLFNEAGEAIASGTSRYLRIEETPADPQAAGALALADDSPGLTVERIRKLGEEPYSLERSFIPEQYCPGLGPPLRDRQPESLYLLIEQLYTLLITRTEEKVRAGTATTVEAEALNGAVGAPVIRVERVAYSLGDLPIEWRLITALADRVHYHPRHDARY